MGVEIFQPNNAPRNDGTNQLASFFLISYNQEDYIREAVAGALAQTYQPLEIILSDDCSTDRTFEIMRQMVTEYQGPHKIILNRNEPNLGLCGNVNGILEMASGEIVVIAGGDDISLPDRVEKSCRILSENPDATCVSFQIQIIDASGVPSPIENPNHGELEKYSLTDFISREGLHLNGASRAFRKSVYSYFGPLSRKAATEDSTMFLRCLMLGTACHSTDLGIYYRVHGGNYFSSNNKYSIKYKRIYWQYLTDMRVALSKGAISPADAQSLKKILRRSLRHNVLNAGFYLASSRARYFFTKLLFSNIFGPREKLSYFARIFRQK